MVSRTLDLFQAIRDLLDWHLHLRARVIIVNSPTKTKATMPKLQILNIILMHLRVNQIEELEEVIDHLNNRNLKWATIYKELKKNLVLRRAQG